MIRVEDFLRRKSPNSTEESRAMINKYLDQFAYKKGNVHVQEKPQKVTVPVEKLLNKQKRKQHLNKRLRSEVWSTYMGSIFEGMCYCCNRKQIDVFSYHCGHVKSEHYGGEATLQNLRPICSLCNMSGSVRHMRDFAKQNGFVDAPICQEDDVVPMCVN